jgi:hypothetical protein
MVGQGQACHATMWKRCGASRGHRGKADVGLRMGARLLVTRRTHANNEDFGIPHHSWEEVAITAVKETTKHTVTTLGLLYKLKGM